MRSVELAFLFGCVDGKFLEEVLIYSSDQVFFLAKCLVAYFVDFIHDLFDIIGRKIASGESTLNKASLQLLATCSNAVQCVIKCNIEFRCRFIDDC